MTTSEMEPGFKERLAIIIGDEAPHAWGARMGITGSTWSGLWKGEATPSSKTLIKIAWQTNVSLTWLLTGRGTEKIDGTDNPTPVELAFSKPIHDLGEGYQVPKEASYVLVPRYDVGVGAGPGRSVHSEQIVDHLAFKADWIKRVMGLDPKQLALVSVRGDSMEPTLKEGDLLLLDRREAKVRNDAIYVMRRDDDLIAKRLQRGFDGSVTIQSDNSAYEKQIISQSQSEQLHIIGRVIWTGRRI